jgi:NDP-sugar pyrophosphorylase family protein
MKALLICPAERPGAATLAPRRSLAALPFLGLSVVEHWMQHFALHGAKRVTILAADRPNEIAALVDDGARWGLEVEVVPVADEPSIEEARARHRGGDTDWLATPLDVVMADRLPALPNHRPFASLADFFATARDLIPHTLTPDRVGLHEVRPGIWFGFHARVASTAQLRAPCWIGEDTYVGPGAIIGPNAVLENRVLVEEGAHVFDSIVGPDTFVGGVTEIAHSIAWGNQLIDWRTGSSVRVVEEFLLCSLEKTSRQLSPTAWARAKAGTLSRALTLPVNGLLRRARSSLSAPPAQTPRAADSRVPF